MKTIKNGVQNVEEISWVVEKQRFLTAHIGEVADALSIEIMRGGLPTTIK